MKTFSTLITLLGMGYSCMAQNAIQWQQSFGGSAFEFSKELEPTPDGGYIAAGCTQSTDGDVTGAFGLGDCWLFKLDATGNKQWSKNYGGSAFDFAYSVKPTIDHGYIMAGATESADGNVSMQFGNGDCWIVKLDSVGSLVWEKSFGGSQVDKAQCIQQTTDGGYVVAGYTESNDGHVGGNHGGGDCWVVKLDVNGNVQWQKCLGGSAYDFAQSIIQTADGNYVVAGGTNSCNGNVSMQHGNGDCWIVKLSNTGNLIWQKSLGGSDYDYAQSVQQTVDGGFVIAAYSQSVDGDVTGALGNGDCWVVKCDAFGTIQWQKAMGSNGNDYAYSIKEKNSGGFVMVGYSEFNNGDVTGNHGNYDGWMVQMSASGQLLMQQSVGGSGVDIAYDVCETGDGAFIVAGYSESLDGDVTSNHGGGDSWVIKLNNMSVGVEEQVVITTVLVSPNPSSGLVNFLNVEVGSRIRVYSLTGALIMETKGEEGYQMDLSNEAKGIYYYKIEGKQGSSFTGKLMLN